MYNALFSDASIFTDFLWKNTFLNIIGWLSATYQLSEFL